MSRSKEKQLTQVKSGRGLLSSRRHALHNIMEGINQEDILILNLDYEFKVEQTQLLKKI